MSRAAAIVGIGAGLALLFVATRADAEPKPASLTYNDLAMFLDAQGLITLDPSAKPVVNSEGIDFSDPSIFTLSGARRGLRGSDVFDWGSWATEFEWWSPDPVIAASQSSDPIAQETGMPTEISTDELVYLIAEHLKGTEGFRPWIYDDWNGKPWTQSKIQNPTIGYGHLVTKKDIAAYGWDWALDETGAYNLLIDDIRAHLGPVIPAVKVPLTAKQWVVIASLAFGSGPVPVKKSRFLKALNTGDVAAMEIEFKDWNKSTVVVDGVPQKYVNKGLVNRRNKEWVMFTEPGDQYALAGQNYA